jgi:hypothetical protein
MLDIKTLSKNRQEMKTATSNLESTTAAMWHSEHATQTAFLYRPNRQVTEWQIDHGQTRMGRPTLTRGGWDINYDE